MSKGTSKETLEERLTGKQNKTLIAVALIGALATILVGVLALPPFQEWIRNLGREQKIEALAIEQVPQRVFAYYGQVENVGGFAKLDLLFDGTDGKPVYALAYNLPGDQTGYVGLAFQFEAGSNLSNYDAVECTVTFSQLSDVVDLYFKDIANNFNTIRVSNNGANEMRVRYEFTNFPKINFNAVKEFGIVVSSDFSTGSHQANLKNVRFVK